MKIMLMPLPKMGPKWLLFSNMLLKWVNVEHTDPMAKLVNGVESAHNLHTYLNISHLYTCALFQLQPIGPSTCTVHSNHPLQLVESATKKPLLGNQNDPFMRFLVTSSSWQVAMGWLECTSVSQHVVISWHSSCGRVKTQVTICITRLMSTLNRAKTPILSSKTQSD